MAEDGLYLASSDLCSKWGFNDGDAPDELLDRLEASGDSYDELNWNAVLRGLVMDHLLPQLAQHHRVKVYDIETIHNPIRAREIDGCSVDSYDTTSDWNLMPTGVVVPWTTVLSAIAA